MKVIEIMEKLFAMADERDYSKTRDTCKAGNPEAEVQKVAVTMFPTVKVIEEAHKWGAQLLIVHESLYFQGQSTQDEDDIVNIKKKELVEASGMTIFRYHDYAHYSTPDIIAVGEFDKLGLKGRLETTEDFDLVRLRLDEPITALELAKLIEERLNIKHVRICGARDIKSDVISSVFGAGGVVAFDELKRDISQIVLVGETCEYAYGEYARDTALLGFNKSLLILGHVGSERNGMEYTADLLKKMCPDIEVKYFECDEVYTYTD